MFDCGVNFNCWIDKIIFVVKYNVLEIKSWFLGLVGVIDTADEKTEVEDDEMEMKKTPYEAYIDDGIVEDMGMASEINQYKSKDNNHEDLTVV